MMTDVAKMGEREWYLYSLRDRKYPTGIRTNRATESGYWKATGKDREVYSASFNNGSLLIGMKKTLVFYKGRAPRGHKTKWVMHEYRLDGHFSYRHASKEEWVICRIFHKNAGGEKKNVMLSMSEQAPMSGYNSSLPPLLEWQSEAAEMQALQNPNFQPLQNDLKSLMNSSNYSHINPILNNSINNMNHVIMSTHSEADEANSKFIMGMKMEPNPGPECCNYHQQYPLFSEMDYCGSTSIPAMAAARVSVHDVSASVAFNSPGYHTSTSAMLMANLGR